MPRTLRFNSLGDDVMYLQRRLNALPSALELLDEDGQFGPLTETRVKEFQREQGLADTGVVDPDNWARLLGRQVVETDGFCVLGRDLYDRYGGKVLLRGVNKMSVWEDPDDERGQISFPEIRKTGANSVRIVWAIRKDLKPGPSDTSTMILDDLIANAKVERMIPMIELHDATADLGRLGDLVDYWTGDALPVIQKHAPYLLVNIGNEVGDYSVTEADFFAAYSAAITRMRAAGIHTPLVIDAPDGGKNLELLNNCAQALLDADPDGNLVFSVHIYWALSEGADAVAIRARLEQAAALDYPLIAGEFSNYGAWLTRFNGDLAHANICAPDAGVDYNGVMAACDEFQIGWYAWEWGPGNAKGGYPDCWVMDMTPDRLFASLNAGYAREVALTSPHSIQKTSVTPGWM